ncbi:unnamed protein product [Lactuca virosa]|uniref:Transmembrane protein n=1 Tax=Lactuca virosa TaxID=75947 RepID=A0AAU9NAA6_9ASTR|nr:unnamed protein product [Lactuca virosa]
MFSVSGEQHEATTSHSTVDHRRCFHLLFGSHQIKRSSHEVLVGDADCRPSSLTHATPTAIFFATPCCLPSPRSVTVGDEAKEAKRIAGKMGSFSPLTNMPSPDQAPPSLPSIFFLYVSIEHHRTTSPPPLPSISFLIFLVRVVMLLLLLFPSFSGLLGVGWFYPFVLCLRFCCLTFLDRGSFASSSFVLLVTATKVPSVLFGSF